MNSPVLWYATRASALAGFVVLTLTIVLGLALSGKARSVRWPRASVADLHRFGSLWAGGLVTMHVATIALDSYQSFGIVDLLVPFEASYRPLYTGLGVAAAELLLLVALTNRFRKRLGARRWRRAHYLTLAVWALAAAHGIGAGTDTSEAVITAAYATSIVAVAAFFAWRVVGTSGRLAPARPPRGA